MDLLQEKLDLKEINYTEWFSNPSYSNRIQIRKRGSICEIFGEKMVINSKKTRRT